MRAFAMSPKRSTRSGTLRSVNIGFDAFFRANYSPVVGALSLVVGSRDIAEDVAQHGFYQALRRWRRVSLMANPVGWVYVVALRHARKAGRIVEAIDDHAAEIEASSSEIRVVERMAIDEAIGLLSPRQRSVFVLRHVAGLSAVDIAESLGVSASTVRVLDHQARGRLQAVLGAEVMNEESPSNQEAFDAI